MTYSAPLKHDTLTILYDITSHGHDILATGAMALRAVRLSLGLSWYFPQAGTQYVQFRMDNLTGYEVREQKITLAD